MTQNVLTVLHNTALSEIVSLVSLEVLGDWNSLTNNRSFIFKIEIYQKVFSSFYNF